MDRLPLLERTTAGFLASEYIAYRRWAKRRKVVYVCPLADYHAAVLTVLGITAETVDVQVRILDAR